MKKEEENIVEVKQNSPKIGKGNENLIESESESSDEDDLPIEFLIKQVRNQIDSFSNKLIDNISLDDFEDIDESEENEEIDMKFDSPKKFHKEKSAFEMEELESTSPPLDIDEEPPIRLP
jgi:hypothetical protein